MPKNRKDTWITLIIVAVAVPVALVVGIVTFVKVTDTPLHPNPAEVPSVSRSAPLPKWSDAAERGRQTARAALVEQNLPGLSVAVGIAAEGAGQEPVWVESFGWGDLEKRVPMAPEMRIRIGHASKALTSAGVGLLLEKGRVRLDDEIQKYVPAFPAKKWPITLRQLMGHVAGIGHYKDTEWGDQPTTHCDKASEGLHAFENDPLLFEPGSQYRYSTYGWVLVSAAVEAAAAEPFFTFMRDKLFRPLGMSATTPDSPYEPGADRATPYYHANFGLKLATDFEFSCFAGAAGFLSTPSDLVRFGLAMTNGKLLQPATVSLLQTRQILSNGDETGYGLGWMLETIPFAGEQTRLAFHSARSVLGGTTSLVTFPERGLVVAVAANSSYGDTKSIAIKIAEAFAGQPKEPSASGPIK